MTIPSRRSGDRGRGRGQEHETRSEEVNEAAAPQQETESTASETAEENEQPNDLLQPRWQQQNNPEEVEAEAATESAPESEEEETPSAVQRPPAYAEVTFDNDDDDADDLPDWLRGGPRDADEQPERPRRRPGSLPGLPSGRGSTSVSGSGARPGRPGGAGGRPGGGSGSRSGSLPGRGNRPTQPPPARPSRPGGRPGSRPGGLPRTRPGQFDAPANTEEGIRQRVEALLQRELGTNDLFGINDPEFSTRLRARIGEYVDRVITENDDSLSTVMRTRIRQTVIGELVGFGPIQVLLDDPQVSEVLVLGPDRIYIRRDGPREQAPVAFRDDEHLSRTITRMAERLGHRLNVGSPSMRTNLPDGSWLTIAIPPLATDGPTLTVRKALAIPPLTDQNLIDFGTASAEMLAFMRAAVAAGMNIIISGENNAGRTTLLNALLSSIPEHELTVLVEDFPELQPPGDLVTRLRTHDRPPGPRPPGGGQNISIKQLVDHALRMTPERIVVGQVANGEVYDLTQMASVRFGSWLATIAAINPLGALDSLHRMCGWRTGANAYNIRQQVVDAVDVIVHTTTLRDGSRRVISIVEALGATDTGFEIAELFTFRRTGWDASAERVEGEHSATGVTPTFLDRMAHAGVDVLDEWFMPC